MTGPLWVATLMCVAVISDDFDGSRRLRKLVFCDFLKGGSPAEIVIRKSYVTGPVPTLQCDTTMLAVL